MQQELEALAQTLGQQLSSKQFKLVTAESCTGGGLGFYLTSIAGSSDWFERGFITYSNNAKMEMLNVKFSSLESHGAVSEIVAREMAEGALQNSDSQISVAITGIAGPDGGSTDKPVGTVWIAYVGHDFPATAEVHIFSGNREAVRLSTIKRALEHLITITR